MALMNTQQRCWQRVRQACGASNEASLRAALQDAKQAVRASKQGCRNRWVSQIIQAPEEALTIHDL